MTGPLDEFYKKSEYKKSEDIISSFKEESLLKKASASLQQDVSTLDSLLKDMEKDDLAGKHPLVQQAIFLFKKTYDLLAGTSTATQTSRSKEIKKKQQELESIAQYNENISSILEQNKEVFENEKSRLEADLKDLSTSLDNLSSQKKELYENLVLVQKDVEAGKLDRDVSFEAKNYLLKGKFELEKLELKHSALQDQFDVLSSAYEQNLIEMHQEESLQFFQELYTSVLHNSLQTLEVYARREEFGNPETVILKNKREAISYANLKNNVNSRREKFAKKISSTLDSFLPTKTQYVASSKQVSSLTNTLTGVMYGTKKR